MPISETPRGAAGARRRHGASPGFDSYLNTPEGVQSGVCLPNQTASCRPFVSVRLATFPPMMLSLAVVLLLEAAAINWISSPTAFERQLGPYGEDYTIDYHEPFVIEKTQELLLQWGLSSRNQRVIYGGLTPHQTSPPMDYYTYKKAFAEKMSEGKPWWETDYNQLPRRFRGPWAKVPPRRSDLHVERLVKQLSKLSLLCGGSFAADKVGTDPEKRRADLIGAGVQNSADVVDDAKQACVVAAAIGESLSVTLARDRAEVFTLQAEAQLGRVRDLLHDTLYAWCDLRLVPSLFLLARGRSSVRLALLFVTLQVLH